MSEVETDKTWQDLVGFDSERPQFMRLVAEGTIPPVILFEGRAGIGKSLFSRYLASLLYCQTGKGCGQCADCREVAQNKHNEILIFDRGDETLKVSDAREVLEHLSIEPASSGSPVRPRRIVILNDVDRFTEEALNLLLKTIEEPPPHALILMSTSRTYALLQTILSRSVNWQLKPAPKEVALRTLERLINEQNINLPSYLRLEDLLELNGLSIGSTLTTLRDSALIESIQEGIRRLFEAKNPFDALHAVEGLMKVKELNFNNLITQIEFFLTKRYRENIRLGKRNPVGLISERRRLLSLIHKYGLQKRIALNLRLNTEALALMPFASGSNNI